MQIEIQMQAQIQIPIQAQIEIEIQIQAQIQIEVLIQAKVQVQAVLVLQSGKIIHNGARVSGTHGMLVDKTDGKQRVREMIFRNFSCSAGLNKYTVDFNNNTSKDCTSYSLCIKTNNRSVQPSEITEANVQDTAREDSDMKEDEAHQEAAEHEIGDNEQHEGKYILLVFVLS